MWCVIELNMSIFGGNVPTFKPFIRKYFPGLLASTVQNNGTYGYGSQSGTANHRRGSYRLKSFDPESTNGVGNIKGFSKTTVTGLGSSRRNQFGESESEEHIIQGSDTGIDRDLERSGTTTPGPLYNGGFGKIKQTVEYRYSEQNGK